MRKLFNEFFYIPKHGKIREKVILTRIAATITIMVICLAAMSITAYAYFSHNVTSCSNIIKAANFEANVLIKKTEPNKDSVITTKNGKVQTANLEPGKYTIELTAGNSTADKGFCVITIGDKKYYTDQIGVDADKNSNDAIVKFELLISAPTKIEVLSHWGTSVYYGYKDNANTAIFIVNGYTINLTNKTENSNVADSKNSNNQTEETTNSSSGTTPPTTETSTPETGEPSGSTEESAPETEEEETTNTTTEEN